MSELRLVVDIPFAPPKEANPNARVHYRKRNKANQDAKLAAWLAAHEGRIHRHWTKVTPREWSVSVDWTVYLPKGAHVCDTDNMIGRAKPFMDGIFQAIGINDRIVGAISVKQERDPEGRGRTVAVVTARRKEEA